MASYAQRFTKRDRRKEQLEQKKLGTLAKLADSESPLRSSGTPTSSAEAAVHGPPTTLNRSQEFEHGHHDPHLHHHLAAVNHHRRHGQAPRLHENATATEVEAAAAVAQHVHVDNVNIKVSADLDNERVLEAFTCSLGCGQQFRHPKLRERHESKQCNHREVACPNSGCGSMVKLINLNVHRKYCLYRDNLVRPTTVHDPSKAEASHPPKAQSLSRRPRSRLLASAEASSERGSPLVKNRLLSRTAAPPELTEAITNIRGGKLESETAQAARRRRLRDHTVRFQADEIRHFEEDQAVFNEPWYDFPDRKAALQSLFHLLDTDGSGYLDAHEFRRMGRAQSGSDCSLVQARMEIAKADSDGDGELSMEEWLKFSEPLRLMPARAFLTLVHAFTTALKADDTTMVMDRVKKERMFAAQDAYDERVAHAARARKLAKARSAREAALNKSLVSLDKGPSRETALIAEIGDMLVNSSKKGRDLKFDDILRRIKELHGEWNLTRIDVHRAWQAARDVNRVTQKVKATAKESVLEAYSQLDPSWGIVIDPRDLS